MKEVIIWSIIFWLVLNLSVTFSVSSADTATGTCNTDFNRRIEYLVPGHVFGCWLFEDLKEEKAGQ